MVSACVQLRLVGPAGFGCVSIGQREHADLLETFADTLECMQERGPDGDTRPFYTDAQATSRVEKILTLGGGVSLAKQDPKVGVVTLIRTSDPASLGRAVLLVNGTRVGELLGWQSVPGANQRSHWAPRALAIPTALLVAGENEVRLDLEGAVGLDRLQLELGYTE